jgi:hypothetical protein
MCWDVMHRTRLPIWDTNKKSKPSHHLHVLIGREEDNLHSGGQTECIFEDYELLDFACSGIDRGNKYWMATKQAKKKLTWPSSK